MAQSIEDADKLWDLSLKLVKLNKIFLAYSFSYRNKVNQLYFYNMKAV